MNIHPWANTLYLCEPNALHRLTTQAASYDRCFGGREVAKARGKELDGIEQLASAAIASTGVTTCREEIGHARMSAIPEGTGDRLRMEAPRAVRAVKGKVGVIPIHGPVDQRMSSALMKTGGTSLEFVSAALDRLISDPSIGAIVLHIDSPGGSTYGTEELGTKIYNARGRKQIYAIADSMAASAGYWLASSASMVICTPGGDVGSVGVYAMHVDESKAMELQGMSVQMVSAGKYKTELNPFAPLGDEARANMQEQVNATYDKFLGALKRNRNTSIENVRANFGQGRVFSAEKALAAGMVDRILSLEELLAKLTGASGDVQTAGGRAAASEVSRLRMMHEQRKRKIAVT